MNPKEELLNNLLNKYNNCQDCGLHKFKTTNQLNAGDTNADLLIVSDYPNYSMSFISDKITEFRSIMPNSLFFITYALCGKPPDEREPLFEEEILKCNQRLFYTIYLIRPKIIVALGSVAAKALLPELKLPLKDHIGQPLKFDISDLSSILYITYHPKYLDKAPSNRLITDLHWAEIKGMLKCSITSRDKKE
jgi:uracil-DNA glycosylase family 4